MSDDFCDGDGDEFDSLFLDQADMEQIEAVEKLAAANKSPGKAPRPHGKGREEAGDSLLVDEGDDDWDDPRIMHELMQAECTHMSGAASSSRQIFKVPASFQQRSTVAGPSRSGAGKVQGPSSSAKSKGGTGGAARQYNLFGEAVPMQSSSQGMLLVARKAHTATATASQRVRDAMSMQNHRFSLEQKGKRKEWDRSQPLDAKKGKISKSFFDEEDDDEGGEEWDDPTEADDAFIEIAQPPPPDVLPRMKVEIDREAARSWIYPTNKERRDYQFNIVQRALFNNVLVALPTGLGKTLIAAVVILNYYRWFPLGKIIFVAPTKPLVAQQQQACHGICGLPWDCAVEMTGGTKASLRGDEWKTKRIFYMTPQTFDNDLCSGAVNAEDVVCVVVDEAHRSTGNYAYGRIVRWITARNPFFRVLALTATPGNKPDKVQEVIDNLHINLIEIRTEEAADIRKYVHTKAEDAVVVPLGGVVNEMKGLVAKMMVPLMETLQKHGLIHMKDPCSLAPYSVQRLTGEPHSRKIVNDRKLYNQVSDLRFLAQAMETLIRYSVQMFFQTVCAAQAGVDERGKKASTKRQMSRLQNNTIIRDLERVYHQAQDANGKVRHPKMEYLQNVVAAHFASEEEQGRKEDTRIMVFCHLRECVTEIVELLNEQHGIKATTFIGQASDTKGNKGMNQKEQEKVVREFKKGDFNVMVATSIGEEGLDIGEVDLIVCYEAVKNSVRMLQRVGRTGRKRNGRIVVLMAEGPEERNWQHSKDNHKTIQNELINGSHLELFDDVERLVPEDITSEAVFQDVEQPPFEPTMIKGTTRQKKVARPKRNSDPMRNIPENGIKGFIKVSDLKKKRKKPNQISNREGDSDDSDSVARILPSPDSSIDGERAEEKKSKKRQKSLCLTDDSEDEALARGIIFSSERDTSKPLPGKNVSRPGSDSASVPSSDGLLATPASKTGAKRTGRLGSGRPVNVATPQSAASRESASSHVEGELFAPSSSVDAPSPLGLSTINVRRKRMIRGSEGGESVEEEEENLAVEDASSSPVKIRARTRRPHPLVARLAANLVDDEECGPVRDDGENVELQDLDSSVDVSALPKRKRVNGRQRTVLRLPSSSPVATMGPPSMPYKAEQRGRLEKAESQKPKKMKKKMIRGSSPTSRKLFAFEADRSTDEEIHGERDEDDDGQDTDEADSSDREHVGDFAPTQAPRGYNQNAIYMQSLLSQSAATPFRRPPRAPASAFQMGIEADQVRQYRHVDSSHNATPSRSAEGDGEFGSEDEDYERDSFVCSDNEEEEEYALSDSQQTSSAL